LEACKQNVKHDKYKKIQLTGKRVGTDCWWHRKKRNQHKKKKKTQLTIARDARILQSHVGRFGGGRGIVEHRKKRKTKEINTKKRKKRRLTFALDAGMSWSHVGGFGGGRGVVTWKRVGTDCWWHRKKKKD
jgi:hypothetical protein